MHSASLPRVFGPSSNFVKGKAAWRDTLRLTTLAAEKVRSSLGPRGSYKMITYNRGPEKICKITRDAVPVLDELAIQYPNLAVLAEAAKLQREQIGDGVTTFTIIAAALLKNADKLIVKGVHPTVILNGYLEACRKAKQILEANPPKHQAITIAKAIDIVDCGRDILDSRLRNCIIEAAERAKTNGKLEKERIKIIRKPGGEISETTLVRGVVIKKAKLHPNMPDRLAEPRIVMTSERIGMNRLELKMPREGPFHMKFNLDTPEKLVDSQRAERKLRLTALKKLVAFGANVLLSQQPIDMYSRAELVREGVLAFECVDKEDMTLVSKATGAHVLGNLATLTESDVGIAQMLETDKIGLEKIMTILCPRYSTFLLRGSALQAIDELETIIKNSLTLIQNISSSGDVVPGGGASEMNLARELKNYANKFSGREQFAIESFAEALLEVPRCLAQNNGLNAEDAMIQLNTLHTLGYSDVGIGLNGCCGWVCSDLLDVEISLLLRAFELVSLMLRIDEQVIRKEIVKFHKKQ